MLTRKRRPGIVSPVIHSGVRLRFSSVHIIAEMALKGVTKDVRFGLSLGRKGVDRKDIWLDGRIHASEICIDLAEIAEVVPCQCGVGKDHVSMSPIRPVDITLIERLDVESPNGKIACCMESLAIRNVARNGRVEISEFPSGIEGGEIEFTLTYKNHILLARVDENDLCGFVHG